MIGYVKRIIIQRCGIIYILKMKDVVWQIVERSVNNDQVEFLFIDLKFVKLITSFLI